MKKIYISFLCVFTSLLLCLVAFANDVSFTDVKSTSWYYDAVNYVVENNIMNGTSQTTFEPKTSLSRAMTVRILASIEGIDDDVYSAKNTFSDVNSTSWYHSSVEWAYENHITSGMSATTFAPKDLITREQLVSLIYNYAQMIGVDTTLTYDTIDKDFTDTSKIHSWAKDAVVWAVQNEIIVGSNAQINPRSNATRAEAAVIFANFHKNFCSNDKLATGVTISKTFGNNMVIQRDKELSVWGWCDEGQEGAQVIVTFKGETATANVEDDGKWIATFDKTFDADSNGATLNVKAAGVNINIQNILVGDVYYVIGQSNVHWSMRGLEKDLKTNHVESWISDISYNDSVASNIRLIRSSMMYYVGNTTIPVDKQAGSSYVFEDIYSDRTKWRTTTEMVVPSDPSEATENIMAAEDFSAIGYLFAYNIQKEIGVPVGMIEIDASGCPLTSFAPGELTTKWGSDAWDVATQRYCMKTGSEKFGNATIYNWMPSRFAYNQMLRPFLYFNISGIVWYQGESDMVNTKSIYGLQTEWTFSTELADLMTFFRENMGSCDNNFPVYAIEYPTCYSDASAFLATGNVRSELGTLPMLLDNSYVVPSSDLWTYRRWDNNIHPFCKPMQAKRLAKMVLANEYGIGDVDYLAGPTLSSVEYVSDNKAVLKFNYVGDGLIAFCEDESGEIYGLQVLTSATNLSDGYWADAGAYAEITGKNELTITFKSPIYGVRYDAITDYLWPSQVNLSSSTTGKYGQTYCMPCVAFADYKLALTTK